MKRIIGICLLLSLSAALLAFFIWPSSKNIRLYTEDELVGLTCAELGEKHEEVIFAYHDASIDLYRETGSFGDHLGIPSEDVLPFVILMKKVIRDNNFAEFDVTKAFFHFSSTETLKSNIDFYYETSRICAINPQMDAIAAMVQAEKNLNRMDVPANPQ